MKGQTERGRERGRDGGREGRRKGGREGEGISLSSHGPHLAQDIYCCTVVATN